MTPRKKDGRALLHCAKCFLEIRTRDRCTVLPPGDKLRHFPRCPKVPMTETKP